MPVHTKQNTIIQQLATTKERNLVVIDFANVDKWSNSLGWVIGIKELSQMIKLFAIGSQELRRFYYCMDYGSKESSMELTKWSEMVANKVRLNRFELVTKRVKYIPDANYSTGFIKKGNLDIEMTVDMISLTDSYDNLVLFSGDGDLAYATRYLKNNLNKEIYVFTARDHTGKELIDAKNEGVIKGFYFVEDFEYRLKRRS